MRFDNDPVRLVEYYIKLQEQYRDRLLVPPSAAKPGKSAACRASFLLTGGTAL
jgi:hypothetical protein